MLNDFLKGWDVLSAIALAAGPAILLFAFWLWLRSKTSSSGGSGGKKGGGAGGGSGAGGRHREKSSGGRGSSGSSGGRSGGGGSGGGGLGNALTGLGNAGLGLGQGLGNALTGLGNAGLGLGQGLGGLATGVGNLASGLGNGGKSLAQGIGGLAEIGGKGIKSVSSAAWRESTGPRRWASEGIKGATKTVWEDATYGFKRPDWEMEAEIPPHLRGRRDPFGAMAWPVDINDEREVERVLREGGVEFYWRENENGDRHCVINTEHLDNARQVMGEAGWDMPDEEAQIGDWTPEEAVEWADGTIPGEYREAPPEPEPAPEVPQDKEPESSPAQPRDLPALPPPQ